MSAYNPFAKYGRRAIDGIATGSGKDEELARRVQDDAFRAHMELHRKDFPKARADGKAI